MWLVLVVRPAVAVALAVTVMGGVIVMMALVTRVMALVTGVIAVVAVVAVMMTVVVAVTVVMTVPTKPERRIVHTRPVAVLVCVVVVAHTLALAWLVTRCRFASGRLHVRSVVDGVGVRIIVVMAVVARGWAVLGWVTMSVRMAAVVMLVRRRIVVCGRRIVVRLWRNTTLWLVGQGDGHRDKAERRR